MALPEVQRRGDVSVILMGFVPGSRERTIPVSYEPEELGASAWGCDTPAAGTPSSEPGGSANSYDFWAGVLRPPQKPPKPRPH